jgi:hypothetical protein
VRSTDLTVSSVWVKRISYLYLLIPFLVFCLGFIKTFFAIPITLVFLWLIIKDWKKKAQAEQTLSYSRRTLIYIVLIVLLWVALSGIGGFAFQNADFHTRNAIFRDLINYDWPVKYHTSLTDPTTTYSLTYYIGFWLPAALIGKLAGWQVANIALYLWTVIGILLTLFILFSSKKSHPGYFVILIIFFSGMDGLRTLLIELAALPGKTIPSLWPPFMHLEGMLGFQFSSFTTQLFWVFNQAVPTWMCMALLWTANDKKTMLLVWSLCAFFAPLPALGMLPYLVLKIPKELFNPENLKDKESFDSSKSPISRLWYDLRSVITAEDILGGGIVLLITYLYFSANVNSENLTLNSMSTIQWIRYFFLVVFEGLLLWLAFKEKNKKNLNWYLAGFLILIIPLIKVGSTQDFCMRASIPTLFVLMVWSAEMLASPKSQMRIVLIILLSIGAITPIYEINRSVYRTYNYYLNPPSQSEKLIGEKMKIYDIESFEYDHPFTLTADSFKSLANINPEKIPYFLAKSDHSFFYEYVAK